MDAAALDDTQLDLVFRALGDATRRRLLNLIAAREWRVTELAEQFPISLNAVSKHLKTLERAGLLTRTVDGRVHRCRMNHAPLQRVKDVVAFYQRYWEEHMDHLARALVDLETGEPQ